VIGFRGGSSIYLTSSGTLLVYPFRHRRYCMFMAILSNKISSRLGWAMVQVTMTKLLIIRHGNTFNADDTPTRVGCRTDLPLTSSGHEQGKKLHDYIRDHGLMPDVIYASALQRAQQTAAYLSDTVLTDTRFNEIDHGPDENKSEADIIERIGKKSLEDWDEYNVVPDGWIVDPRAIQKSWIDVANESVRENTEKTTCVVSSGGIIRFAPILVDGDLPDNASPKVKTASMSLFEYDGSQWMCRFWNKRP